MDSCDVLIVGGGLTGCAAAFHLAKAGASVVLVEQGDINAGASGQNAGSLHFQIERRFLEHGEALAEQAARVIALNRLAIDEWRQLEALLGCDLEIAFDGGLMVATTPDEMRLLTRKAKREADYDIPTRLIDGDEARAIAPYLAPEIIGATWLADEGHANPRILTPAFARAAVRSGAEIRTQTSVNAIARASTGFAVSTADAAGHARLHADQLLIATGAWAATTAALANVHLPVFPVGLTMSVSARTRALMPHLIQHVGRRLSMKQAHDGNIVIGGGWASRLRPGVHGGFDLSGPPLLQLDVVRENLRAAVATVPATAQLSLIRSWTGTVALTADQLPIVGEIPSVPGLHVCVGGSGFTLGPTFARFLADSIGGLPVAATDVFTPFSPARFEHLNSFMGLP
ncbi:NAD(P)/FAD-dependent oxidoreductase [Sphingosinicella microcystinivorans]|uniref:NAD(P)/FAD-dependent oxidoreductase n=1 Tax=Sphingosinicella microcystinivorans TaxID=335406 RepID=UPI0022F38DD4|nr:FAD-dependent oxidoreductase [Sphingosinicella microcystinivorans]WBX84157.1 FAD-dependent oxidoreductase [Sphingosinicella microcystinivorans]